MNTARADSQAGPFRYPFSEFLIEHLPSGVILQNAVGEITAANPAAERILGLSLDQMRGLKSVDPRWRALHEDGSAFPSDQHPAMIALRRGEPVLDVVMGVLNPKRQTTTWINICAFPIPDPAATAPCGVYTVLDDISLHKRAESQQVTSEAGFQSVFAAMTEGMALHRLLYDDAGRPIDYEILDVNPAFTDHTGIAREAVIGQRASVAYGLDKALFLEQFAEVVETGEPLVLDNYVSPLGRHFRIRAFSSEPDHFATIFENITERQIAHEILHRQRAMLARTERIAQLGSWEWEIATDKVTWSEELFRRFQLNSAEGAPPYADHHRLYLPTDFERLDRAVKQAVSEGTPYELELRIKRADGTLGMGLARGEAERDQDGRIIRLVGSLQDITARKQAEQIQAFLARTSSQISDPSFFHTLVKQLAEQLDASAVTALRLEGDGRTARTLATWDDGQFGDLQQQPQVLEGTVCDAILGQTLCSFPVSSALACECMPDAPLPADEAEHYLGASLWSRDGQPIGLIVLRVSKAVAASPWVGNVLEQVAIRASGELERLNAEHALRASEHRLATLVANLPGFVYRCENTPGWPMQFLSEQVLALTGYAAEDFIAGRVHYSDLIHIDDRRRLWEAVQAALQEQQPFTLEYRIRHADGRERWFWEQGRGQLDQRSHQCLLEGLILDVTERRHVKAALQESEERYRELFNNIRNGVAIYEVQGDGQDFVLKDFNRAAERIDGDAGAGLLRGRSVTAEVRPGIEALGLLDVFRRVSRTGLAEHCSSRRCGSDQHGRWYEYFIYRLSTGEIVAVFNDITALKQHEEQLERLAYSDALTGLPNRILLADRLQQGMAQVQRRRQQLAVAYFDLDGFKPVNDRHGHAIGDQLLITLAARLKAVLREGDTLARLGGDEFVAVLVDLASADASVPLLRRLLTIAAEPIRIADLDHRITISLGVTFYPQAEEVDPDQLLRQADQAMYQAKLAGKNRYHRFDAELDRSKRGRHQNLERARLALVRHELVLYYQPKVNMRDGSVLGAEALIRWQHPRQGLLLPADFLPLIEDDPLIISIGEWVIDTALNQLDTWRKAGLKLPVSVNISAHQLQQPAFVNRLRSLIAAHPSIAPTQFGLEILETSALEDVTHISEVVANCRQLGIGMALDDFGTGYSSLTYLKRLPVNTLKIDRTFVRDMLDDPDDLAIVESVIGLSTAFRHQPVAEGVETIEHGELLLQLGCEVAQGYAIARPMPADELPGWIAAWQPDPRWLNQRPIQPMQRRLIYAMAEHRAWISAILNSIRTEQVAPPVLNIHQCRFGEWLDRDALRIPGRQEAIREISGIHQQLHLLASQLLALRGAQGSAALTRVGELQALSDSLTERLQWLLCQEDSADSV